MKNINIYNKTIGENSPVFLIAEAGVNHNGDLSIAKKMVDVASQANVDAIKFQSFKTEELILKSTAKVDYQKQNTDQNENFYDMIKRYELKKEEFQSLANYCFEKGIIFLSTPFDPISLQWLEELNLPAYKVGSGDMNNFPLLKLICLNNKPILISTGMATLNEVKESIEYIRLNGIEEIVVFQCTTNYPTNYDEVNLNVIETYKKEFPDLLVGFSDHSLGITVSLGAVVKGAKVIEKHFTLDKEMEGPDHSASLDPDELKKWVQEIRNIEVALGYYQKKPMKSEMEIAKVARKSIVTTKDLNEGEILTKENITVKRPGIGIPPKEFYKLLNKRVNKDIPKDTILRKEDLYE